MSRCSRCGVLTPHTHPRPGHSGYYNWTWRKHSQKRRAEEGRCQWREPDGRRCTATAQLSVDHPTDKVWCLTHHDREEMRRRFGRKE